MCERVGAYYYFFPTYSQGEKILWRGADKSGFRFMDHFPAQLVSKKNDTKLLVELKNGSIFQIIGTDNIDSVVGTNPIGCVFSEYALQNPLAWDYIRPILAENGGWAIFNFTPRGKNHGYDLYESALNNPKWFVQKLTVDDTNVISKEVLEEEKKEIIEKNGDDALFYQEYYCSFTAGVMGAYYYKQYETAEKAGRFTNVPHDPALKVYTVWDLGIRDSMAIGFFQGTGQERRMIDYVEMTGKGLPEFAKILSEKPYVYGGHFMPHDAEVRELGTGKSRKEVAESLGITPITIVPNLPIQDGIDAARRAFAKLWVDKEKCKFFLKAIPQYTKEYDEEKKVFKDKPNHDWTSHAADMFRYFSLIEDQMTNQTYKPYNQEKWESETSYFN